MTSDLTTCVDAMENRELGEETRNCNKHMSMKYEADLITIHDYNTQCLSRSPIQCSIDLKLINTYPWLYDPERRKKVEIVSDNYYIHFDSFDKYAIQDLRKHLASAGVTRMCCHDLIVELLDKDIGAMLSEYYKTKEQKKLDVKLCVTQFHREHCNGAEITFPALPGGSCNQENVVAGDQDSGESSSVYIEADGKEELCNDAEVSVFPAPMQGICCDQENVVVDQDFVENTSESREADGKNDPEIASPQAVSGVENVSVGEIDAEITTEHTEIIDENEEHLNDAEISCLQDFEVFSGSIDGEFTHSEVGVDLYYMASRIRTMITDDKLISPSSPLDCVFDLVIENIYPLLSLDDKDKLKYRRLCFGRINFIPDRDRYNEVVLHDELREHFDKLGLDCYDFKQQIVDLIGKKVSDVLGTCGQTNERKLLHIKLSAAVYHEQHYNDPDSGLVPAAASPISRLEKVLVDDLDEDTKELQCSICLERMDYDSHDHTKKFVMRLPCKHVFHDGCVAKWLSTSHKCPLCLFEFPVKR